GEALAGKGQVVHRPLALGGDRAGPGERRDHQVGDPARSLDVAGDDRGGRLGVQQTTAGGGDLDRAVGAGAGRRVGVGQDADGEEGGGFGHREGAVEVAVDHRVGAGEVEVERLAVDRRLDPQD